MPDMSKTMELYFNRIQEQVDKCYSIAERARQKGLDPELGVESPQAIDLAGRVEKFMKRYSDFQKKKEAKRKASKGAVKKEEGPSKEEQAETKNTQAATGKDESQSKEEAPQTESK